MCLSLPITRVNWGLDRINFDERKAQSWNLKAEMAPSVVRGYFRPKKEEVRYRNLFTCWLACRFADRIGREPLVNSSLGEGGGDGGAFSLDSQ